MDTDKLEERMTPEHLRDVTSTDEVREAVETNSDKALHGDDSKKDPEEDSKSNKTYEFDFEFTGGNGKKFQGKFINEILNIRKRQLSGVLRAQLGSHVPIDALDTMTQEINLMVAHMTFSLVKKPKWAENLQALDDIRILQNLYEEVMAHEATFHGYSETPEVSGETGS